MPKVFAIGQGVQIWGQKNWRGGPFVPLLEASRVKILTYRKDWRKLFLNCLQLVKRKRYTLQLIVNFNHHCIRYLRLETDASILFTNKRTRLPHDEREILILHEAKTRAVFIITSSMCGKEMRLCVKKRELKQSLTLLICYLSSLHCTSR